MTRRFSLAPAACLVLALALAACGGGRASVVPSAGESGSRSILSVTPSGVAVVAGHVFGYANHAGGTTISVAAGSVGWTPTAAGDYLVGVFTWNAPNGAAAPVATLPSTWRAIAEYPAAPTRSGVNTIVAYHQVTATEVGRTIAFSWSMSQYGALNGAFAEVTGASTDPTAAFAQIAATVRSASGSAPTPSLTPNGTGELPILFAAFAANVSPLSNGSRWTNIDGSGMNGEAAATYAAYGPTATGATSAGVSWPGSFANITGLLLVSPAQAPTGPRHVYTAAYYGSGANGGENADVPAPFLADHVDWATTQDRFAADFMTAPNHQYAGAGTTRQALGYVDASFLHHCAYYLDAAGTSSPDCTDGGSVPVAGDVNTAYLHSSAGVRQHNDLPGAYGISTNPADPTLRAQTAARVKTLKADAGNGSASAQLTAVFTDDLGADHCMTTFGEIDTCQAAFSHDDLEYGARNIGSWTSAAASFAKSMPLPVVNNGVSPVDSAQRTFFGGGANNLLGSVDEACFTLPAGSSATPNTDAHNPAAQWTVALHVMLEATALREPVTCFNHGIIDTAAGSGQSGHGSAADGVGNEPLRLYALASYYLGLSPYTLYWFEGGASDLDPFGNEHTGLFPEMAIVPQLGSALETATYSPATMTTDVNALDVLSSSLAVPGTESGTGRGACVFRREFANAFQGGVPIGRIAAIVNRCQFGSFPYPASAMKQSYSGSLVVNGWSAYAAQMQPSPGAASATFSAPVPSTIPPATAYILH